LAGSKPIVLKVGGSVLVDGPSYERAAREIALLLEAGLAPIVVVSAMKGVTDLLIRYTEGDAQALERAAQKCAEAADYLGGRQLARKVEGLFEEALRARAKGHMTPETRDRILALGEKASKLMMVQALRGLGIHAKPLAADSIIITDDRFGNARILYSETRTRLEHSVGRALSEGGVPVMEGFIGSTLDGRVTTLGRGGSDYTASAVAALLRVSEARFITDVGGILSSDPSIVPRPILVKCLSYSEAMAASLYGVKRLNTKTLEPLVKLYPASIRICGWDSCGTVITETCIERCAGLFKLVAYRGSAMNGTVALIGGCESAIRALPRAIDALMRAGYLEKCAELRARESHVAVKLRGGGEAAGLRLLHDCLVLGECQ